MSQAVLKLLDLNNLSTLASRVLGLHSIVPLCPAGCLLIGIVTFVVER